MSASGTPRIDTSGRIPDDELVGQFNRLRVRSASESKVNPRGQRGAGYGDDVFIQYVGYRLLRPITPSEGEPAHRGRRLTQQESELCRMAQAFVARQSVEECLRNATLKERDAIKSILGRVNHEEPQAAAEWQLVALADEYVWSEELGSRGREYIMILRKQRQGQAWIPSVATQATKVYPRYEPPRQTQPIQIKRDGARQRPAERPSSPRSPVEFSSLQASPRTYLRSPSWDRRLGSSPPLHGTRSPTSESQISSYLKKMGEIEEGDRPTSPTAKQVRFAGAMPMPKARRRNTDPTLQTLRSAREEQRLRRDRQEMRSRTTRSRRSSDAPTKLPELEFSDVDSHTTDSRRPSGWTSGDNSPPTPVHFPSSPQSWQYEGQTSQHFLRSSDRRHSYDTPQRARYGRGRLHVRGSPDDDEHYPRMSRVEEETAKIIGLDQQLNKLLQQGNRREEEQDRRRRDVQLR